VHRDAGHRRQRILPRLTQALPPRRLIEQVRRHRFAGQDYLDGPAHLPGSVAITQAHRRGGGAEHRVELERRGT
jgi:hypothetical protein